MSRVALLARTACAALLLAPLALHAQSAQRWAVQGSVLNVMPSGSAYEGLASGLGFEAQVRYTASAFSLGLGFQSSSHTLTFDDGSEDNVTLSGGFVEPRYVIDIQKPNFAPYIAARLAVLTQKVDINGVSASASGTQINVGGGILVRLSPRINLDLGATYGRINFDDVVVEFEGQTLVVEGSSGSGNNLVLRAGIAIGIR